MNDISKAVLLAQLQGVSKSLATNVQKDAWKNEMQKAMGLLARHVSTGGGDQMSGREYLAEHGRTDLESERVTTEKVMPPVSDIDSMKSGVVSSQAGASGTAMSSGGAGSRQYVFDVYKPLHPQAYIHSQFAADLSVKDIGPVEKRLARLFKLQNINLIQDGEKIRVLIRDYRLDADAQDRLIEDIKSELQEQGYQVSSVIVNGKSISVSR